MNILQIAHTTVYPPKSGGDHRMHGIVSGFPQSGSVIRYCPIGRLSHIYSHHEFTKPERTKEISDSYSEIRDVNFLNDLYNSVPFFDYPPILWEYWPILRVPPDLERLIKWAEIILIERPFIFNAIFQLVEDTPLVYSSHNVEVEMSKYCRDKLLGDLVLDKVLTIETEAVKNSDLVITTSERDRHRYISMCEETPEIYTAPNGVQSTSIYKPLENRNEKRKLIKEQIGELADLENVCLFVGSQFPPNNKAANIIKDMAKKEKLSNFNFIIVGSVGESITDTPSNVYCTGFVEDIEPYYKLSKIALNPIISGSGTNIKVLEYFARSLPVISTKFGMRGIEAADGKHFEESNIEDFPQKIVNLMSNSSNRETIGQNARELIEDKYNWETISQNIYEKLNMIIDDHETERGGEL